MSDKPATPTLTRSHEDATIDRFQRDPQLAAEYAAAVFADGDAAECRQTYDLLTKTFGGLSHDRP